MSIKVYIHYKQDEHPEKTSKLSIPGSWQTKLISDVLGLFVKPYNEKNPEHTIDINDIHIETKDGKSIYNNSTVSESLEDYGDYFIKPQAYVKIENTVKVDKRPRCRNYGCNKHFDDNEVDNFDGACCHHTGPPIFHDTAKFWSCCKDRKAYDFESFQAILGCATGKHSIVDPAVALGASPNAPKPISVDVTPQPVLKSIDDFNSTNPNATTATDSALKSLNERKSTRKEDGTARCLRKGCQKVFNWSDNHPTACVYHKGQAIFHDAAKFWSCCMDKKCYEFEEFLKVPGCGIGNHDDGVVELTEL